jgi:acyl-CoA reductase-like NAD-dependent aldehyde dehydrogenase
MLVGGRLRRAQAGRGRPVRDAEGALVGLATAASGADVTDAVAAARAALPGWAGASADERGRLLYGVAELLDERPDRLGSSPAEASAAADRWLWYVGWTDKIADVLGAVHPAVGSASWTARRPVGVVGVVAPGLLLGLVDVLAPVLATGSTAVVLAPQDQPLAAAGLAEVLTELPAGVANLLTGEVEVLANGLLRAGVDGLDPDGAPGTLADDLRWLADERGIRVPPSRPPGDPGIGRMRAWSEATTVWHPVGR